MGLFGGIGGFLMIGVFIIVLGLIQALPSYLIINEFIQIILYLIAFLFFAFGIVLAFRS
jgi:hypothetical protein